MEKELSKLMEENRKNELKAVFRFIYNADLNELAQIVEEIRCVHNNLRAWNSKIKCFEDIESVRLNGEHIQLNGK